MTQGAMEALGGLMSPWATPPKEKDETDVLTVRQAAKYLKVHEKTLYKYIKKNCVPHTRLGRAIRFSKSQLKQYVDNKLAGKHR